VVGTLATPISPARIVDQRHVRERPADIDPNPPKPCRALPDAQWGRSLSRFTPPRQHANVAHLDATMRRAPQRAGTRLVQ
jgi:hypothetical protein